MAHSIFYRICPGLVALFCFINFECIAQVTVFSDYFNTSTNTSWTTSGQIGTSEWSVFRSGDDWGARRNVSPEQAELTNDVSATTNAAGWVLMRTLTSSFPSPYTTVLENGSMVSWTFNMRQIRTDPSGFNAGNYGIAFILAGETATSNSTGNGYAIVLGQSGSTDPVRLVKYTGGFNANSDLTDIIASVVPGLDDFGDQHLSIRVTFNPCNNNEWELFVRNDGSAFADPTSGVLTSQGTATDSEYTGDVLAMMAGYWNGSTAANQTAFFDNIEVNVFTPSLDPGSITPVCVGSSPALLPYANADSDPDQYSIDFNVAAESAGFVDVVNTPLPMSPIGITVPGSATVGTYSGTLTVSNSSTGCESVAYPISIQVLNCVMPPLMEWILLPNGENSGGACVSTTDCDADQLCYGLQYTPNATGTLTSYTTGFFVDCLTGTNPILSNASCVMTNNSGSFNGCAMFDSVLFNSSGNQGTLPVTQNVPVILHQVCFSVSEGVTLVIDEDEATNLTTSIVLPGNMGVTEFPNYTNFIIDQSFECDVLPVSWISFSAKATGPRETRLEWIVTPDENISSFAIERSVNSDFNFEVIGSVAAETGKRTYEWLDRDARIGIDYYRIRNIDKDGSSTNSVIRSVFFATAGELVVRATPNPASTTLHVHTLHAEYNGQLDLINMAGHQILSAHFESGDTDTSIDISHLPEGIYSLVVTCADKRCIEKVVVIK